MTIEGILSKNAERNQKENRKLKKGSKGIGIYSRISFVSQFSFIILISFVIPGFFYRPDFFCYPGFLSLS
jgi:hypothetical protein